MSECESFIKLYLCLQSQLSSVSPSHRPVHWHSVWGQRGDTDRRGDWGLTASQLDSDQTCQGRPSPQPPCGGSERGNTREKCSIYLFCFLHFFQWKDYLTLFNIVLAAAVSAACSLKVIIPLHPAPVIRKCNVLCSPRDTASVPPLSPPGADTNIDQGPVQLFLVSQSGQPVFK